MFQRRRQRKQQEQLFKELRRRDFFELMWTCHICKQVRPDPKISVLTKQVEYPGMDFNMTQNVRYCNDKPECIEGAKTYSHFNFGEHT